MMNETQTEAFKAIVNYLNDSERRHFISEGEPDDHIYRAGMVLKDFIDGNASRLPPQSPNGEPAPEHPLGQAGPIGIVRDPPSHVDWENSRGPSVPDDVLESMRNKITWSLLNFASLPESIKAFVDSAMKGDDAALLRVAHRALLDYQTDDIPF